MSTVWRAALKDASSNGPWGASGATVILYRGFQLPLPEVLCRCTHCRYGRLRWDGRNAWRCCVRRCREGRSLAAIFDIDDIEFRLQCGYRLDSFPLTDTALDMLRLGVIAFDWLSAEHAQWMYERFHSVPRHGEADESLAWLMREIPARREMAG